MKTTIHFNSRAEIEINLSIRAEIEFYFIIGAEIEINFSIRAEIEFYFIISAEIERLPLKRPQVLSHPAPSLNGYHAF